MTHMFLPAQKMPRTQLSQNLNTFIYIRGRIEGKKYDPGVTFPLDNTSYSR